jgi:bacillithiol biosynthesis cysteine-adding enzyme BshC
MMDLPANYLSYERTGYFTKIVTDYLSNAAALQPFYAYRPDLDGIRQAIEARRKFPQQRNLLAEVLTEQYQGLNITPETKNNIELLKSDGTFTATTAHQPNIFTGPLYFIYKILHTIKLAEELNRLVPGQKFVPVYYMGSEDADLDELGFVIIGGRKLEWKTKQTGAVGRMKVDKALISLITEINGETGVLPFGAELVSLFKTCYTEGKTIQQATLELVNALFGKFGLVVLIPDNSRLKKIFEPVVLKELREGFSHAAVSATTERLGKHYKVQAGGRDVNLFYLLNDKRERIEKTGDGFEVKALDLRFTQTEIEKELSDYPERFSANVILRGAFQETVLPNVAFIGGGGELAYWLELKEVFAAINVPYPVLILRNSFLLIRKEQAGKLDKLGYTIEEIFKDELTLINELVRRESSKQLSLSAELAAAKEQYEHLRQVAKKIDNTLAEHVSALEKQAVKRLEALEKKLLRAERLNYSAQQRQIAALKKDLFPGNSLQERVDNVSRYYALYGPALLKRLYESSTAFNDGFVVVQL